MGRVKGGATTPLASSVVQDKVLRDHIKSATAGKNGLTADETVDLLRSAFPQSYARRNRKLLTQRVAKFIPPNPRAPPVKKPRINETIVLDEDESSDSEGSSEKSDSRDSEGSGDELGQDEDANGKNSPISGELGHGEDVNGNNSPISGELGHGEDVGWSNRPMFKDLGGIGYVIDELKWEVIVPLHQLELMRHLGLEPTVRILLHGPPGCGKTTLARALANEAGLPLHEISGVDLASGVWAEGKIGELFSEAYSRAPSIIFIDEIDAITSKTKNLQKEIKPNILDQLMTCMNEPNRLIKPVNHDASSGNSNSMPAHVLVIGATNRPDDVNPALRRRFDREIVIDAPDENGREQILKLLTHNVKVEDAFDLSKIARCLLGFVGGDLAKLVKKANVSAVKRIMDMRKYNKNFSGEDYYRQPLSKEEIKKVSIMMADFMEAADMVRPSSKVEHFTVRPTAKWDDVVGLESLKLEFERHILKPIKFPELYEDLGVDFTTSFFLYGPSGCGKALIVEALANEAGAKFMRIEGPALAELHCFRIKVVLQIIFSYARTCSPCIVFFNEVETTFRHAVQRHYFKQLLTELEDAVSSGVYVIAATNRPEEFAYFGKGTFDKLLYVPLPTPQERAAILKSLARNKPIDADVDLMALGKDVSCENFSGADLSALVKGATEAALCRPTPSNGGCRLPWTINDEDFKRALKKISPSTSLSEVKTFEEVSSMQGAGRSVRR